MALGVSGVVSGVGNPDDARFHSSSENCGDDGVEVFNLVAVEAVKFLIMENSESALEIFCNLLDNLGLADEDVGAPATAVVVDDPC